jgi:2-iminobutanoate/2-iminopropanoate deaminase
MGKIPKAIGPYSAYRIDGNLLITSGQLPVKPEDGSMAGDDIVSQTRQSLENVKAILEEAGGTMNDIIKTTVFLSDIANFGKMNEIYGEYFQEPYPSRSAFQVAALPKNALVEIEAIAVLKK